MAGLLILIANFSIWLGGSIFNRGVFSDTATAVIRTGPVRDAISVTIIKEAVKDVPELRGAVGASLKDVLSSFLAGSAVRPALDNLAVEVQKSLTAPKPTAVKLDVQRVTKQFEPVLARINNEFGISLSVSDLPKDIVVVKASEMPSIYSWGAPLLWFGPILGIFGLALIIGAVGFAGSTRSFVLMANGLVLTVSALLFLLLIRFAATPLAATAQNASVRAITLKLFDAFSGQLAAQTWFLAGAGILPAAAGILLSRLTASPPAVASKEEKQAA